MYSDTLSSAILLARTYSSDHSKFLHERKSQILEVVHYPGGIRINRYLIVDSNNLNFLASFVSGSSLSFENRFASELQCLVK